MVFPAHNAQINSLTGLTTDASTSILPYTSQDLAAAGSYIVRNSIT